MRGRGLMIGGLLILGLICTGVAVRYGSSPDVLCAQMSGLGRWWYDSPFGSGSGHVDSPTQELCSPPADGVFWLIAAVWLAIAALIAVVTWHGGKQAAPASR